jgi:ABC-2 type transport system ATP-binding protein
MKRPVSPPVVVRDLRKVFKVPVREGGLKESVKSLFNRQYRNVVAVDDVSFQLEPGEIVGFLGPNGAGKTTTIKMLTGLLHPDGGDARVLGFQPWHRDKELLSRISLVMGQRNSLAWDLPAIDSYMLHKAIYQVPQPLFEKRLSEYTEILDVVDLLQKPVRNLSLGERMKMEIVGQLLHGPQVLFLDEPTLGLDVTMQKRLRSFIRTYNQESGATVLLTSHYMADMEALAERVIVIHHGSILHDGPLASLSDRFSSEKTITVSADDMPGDMSPFGRVLESGPGEVVLEVDRDQVPTVAATLLRSMTVTDLTIEDLPLEDVIDRIFTEERESSGESGSEAAS